MLHYNRENLLYIIENHPYYDKINKNIKQKIENVILKKERRPKFSDAIQ